MIGLRVEIKLQRQTMKTIKAGVVLGVFLLIAEGHASELENWKKNATEVQKKELGDALAAIAFKTFEADEILKNGTFEPGARESWSSKRDNGSNTLNECGYMKTKPNGENVLNPSLKCYQSVAAAIDLLEVKKDRSYKDIVIPSRPGKPTSTGSAVGKARVAKLQSGGWVKARPRSQGQ